MEKVSIDSDETAIKRLIDWYTAEPDTREFIITGSCKEPYVTVAGRS